MATARPLNDRQRAFANLCFEGKEHAAAYRSIYGASKGATLRAYKLRHDPRVIAHITALRERSDTKSILTQEDLAKFLSDVIRTPVGELDESSPLAKEINRSESQTSSTETIKAHDKLQAADKLAKLMGWNAPDKVEHDHDAGGGLAALVAQIRTGATA